MIIKNGFVRIFHDDINCWRWVKINTIISALYDHDTGQLLVNLNNASMPKIDIAKEDIEDFINLILEADNLEGITNNKFKLESQDTSS